MQRVVIESPYKGDIPLNEIYGELCMHDCLINHNETPYASHLLYTRSYVLRDHIAEERRLGIKAGFYWRDVSDKTVFYTDLGMTDGMVLGVEDCKKKHRKYEVRRLPDNLWERLETICKLKEMNVPERSPE